jgi:cation transport ATPase
VLDKTGTLTRGKPEVVAVVTAAGGVEPDVVALAAAVERDSEHPLAEAVVAYAERLGAPRLAAGQFEAVPGHGVLATVTARRVAVGARGPLDREGIGLGPLEGRYDELAADGRTVVAVAVDGTVAGLIAIAAGAFAWAGLTLKPEIGALAMSGSSLLVAVNALLLKRARLPAQVTSAGELGSARASNPGGSRGERERTSS